MCWCASCHLHGHPCHVLECCLCFDSLFLTLFLSVCFSYLFFFFFHQNPQLNLFLHHRGNIPLALRQLRSLASWSKTRLSQVMNKTSLTTSTTQRQLKSSSRSNPATRCPRTCAMRNSTRPSAERSLHHCSFRKREEPADRGQAYHSFEDSLLPAQSLSLCHARTGRPVHEVGSLNSCSRAKPSLDSENERIRILLERQKRANSRFF